MPRIEKVDLIKNMPEEQKIFISWFYQFFDNRSAANRRIIDVVPVYYCGVHAGSEFVAAYDATRLYICLSLSIYYTQGLAVAAVAFHAEMYNEANAIFYHITEAKPVWNTTGAALNYCGNDAFAENIYFSRFTLSGYAHMKFIGYRITLV